MHHGPLKKKKKKKKKKINTVTLLVSFDSKIDSYQRSYISGVIFIAAYKVTTEPTSPLKMLYTEGLFIES